MKIFGMRLSNQFSSTLSVSALLMLTACVSYQPQPLVPAQQVQSDWQAQSLDTIAREQLLALGVVQANELPLTQWNRAQLLVAAVANNPTVRAARLQLQLALAGQLTAAQRPNPTLGLGADYSVSQAAGSPWLWSLSLSLLPDPMDRRQLRIALAAVDVQKARSQYAEALWTLRKELRSSVLAWQLSAARSAVLTTQSASQRQLISLLQQRINTGYAAAAEILPLQQALATMQTRQADLANQQVAALTQLAGLLAVPVESLQHLVVVDEDLQNVSNLDNSDLPTWREQALLTRPDMELAVLGYQASELELQQQITQQYPALTIGPGYSWDHGVQKLTAGLNFSLPVFNQNKGAIAEALARRTMAGDAVLSTQLAVLQEIDSSLTMLRAANTAMPIYRQQLALATQQQQQSEFALAQGASDRTTVLAAQINTNSQQLTVLDQVERVQQAATQVEQALRHPLAGSELALLTTLAARLQPNCLTESPCP